MSPDIKLREASPETVRKKLQDHSIVLVDVREPQEYAAERIPGALLFPLSSFDPAALPASEACDVVFHCGTGKRSAMAVSLCLQQGVFHNTHMTGGIQAWKQAGLPTLGQDPSGKA
jgi:rhodanese-related sulfurtransferase